MNRQQRMTGREGGEQQPEERQRLGWIRENLLLVGAGAATAALVALALILAVFGGGEDEEESQHLADCALPGGCGDFLEVAVEPLVGFPDHWNPAG